MRYRDISWDSYTVPTEHTNKTAQIGRTSPVMRRFYEGESLCWALGAFDHAKGTTSVPDLLLRRGETHDRAATGKESKSTRCPHAWRTPAAGGWVASATYGWSCYASPGVRT